MELLRSVEWVTNHDEARGQLLVRGANLAGVIDHARASLAQQFPCNCSLGRLHILRVGWWTSVPCRCRRTIASSNHPRWHYRPARSEDDDAWYGAEVRIEVRRDG